ncbi:fatty-acyl-CoA synthase [Carboxydocella sporoproducens DSM 16521]|uniref:Fatty-acyl-CoA synthase n=2 Tax=Carboxydocella TaxID=178898 RepID=A0A1T4LUL8_9FIRM|nr:MULTISPECIES: AMP-binding protein [Carboxydocella]AVX20622.1 fatty-acyl-CoA synthase [Carboxydocella thermautotrophica]SJZ58430.1 fatty-acyl-CoA synthase [Carboxydocella sporoproducens DSM 16521]
MSELLNVTIGDLFDQTVEKFPDKDALVYVDRDLRLSYRQLQEKVNEVAKALMGLGIQKGEHIAIWATNYPEWIYTQFATGKMGAVLVTVNTNYRAFELEYLLKQSDVTTLIMIENYRNNNYIEMINTVLPELANSQPGQINSSNLPLLKNIIVISDRKYPGTYSWSEFLQFASRVSDADLAARQASLKPDEVINMQYTSGTTGFPKGVMLTHYSILNNAKFVGECQKFSSEDKLCFPVPLFHCFGCVMSTLTCIVYGATMVPIEYFDPVKVLEAVEKERCTALYGVPTMFIAELEVLNQRSFDLSSLRTGIMAGAPCPIEVMKQVVEKMNMREVTIAYGQTEFSPVITQTRTDDPIELRVTTVGRAIPHVEVKIVNPETGETLGPGQQGELCARGFGIMKGYYKMPEATQAAIDNEGWLHTGDLATMDENGYCKITGRLKDMIIRGGENIYPREIEEFLYTHPKILDVQVVGVPDIKYGEEVAAFIRLKEGEVLTEEEVREFCTGKIARHKIPRYIKFVDLYPCTASGKVQKFKLREMAIKEYGLEAAANIETA